ncbi:MAG TPA: serine hydrolase domain-containing protein [Acidimicrobiales bacterium]|nr:serine hydrolase domain-containing protein [Acidimicrobiales bacterium]
MADATTEVHGTCDEQFAAVREAFYNNLDEGRDVGASVTVFLEGEPVVDLWGGWADEERTVPWGRDTITNVWSTTKTMTNLCALILADHGDIDLHAPVAKYWPEFKANDKERIEVRHLLSHTAGLPGWEEPITYEDLYDWEKATSLLAAQKPWWEPGTASGYHAVTQGYLVGEVVRRVTGQSLGTFFAKEVAGPLGADFFIGLPATEDHRTVRVIAPEMPGVDALGAGNEFLPRVFGNPILSAERSFDDDWRRAEIPAANGQGNARGVGAVQSIVSNRGEARGIRLLSDRGLDAIFEEQSNGTDLVLGIPLRFGIGYGLGTETMPLGPRGCYWGGWGGSLVVSDLDARVTVAYVMNRMELGLVGDTRGAALLLATVTGLSPH